MSKSVSIERRVERKYKPAPSIKRSRRDVGVLRAGGATWFVQIEGIDIDANHVRGANGMRWRIGR